MITVAQQLINAFKRRGLDPINDLLFARITVYDETGDREPETVSLYDTGDGSFNMSEEEFYKKLSSYYIDEGYGCDPVTGMVWLTDHKLFIRKDYDGSGYWSYVNAAPPSDIDPNGLWVE